jgi:anti-anti-sigma factor
MTIENWSDDIVLVELEQDPAFSDELSTLMTQLETQPSHVVLNLSQLHFINSSNISRLLRLRKALVEQNKRLILCAATSQVWGAFIITGLDKIFEFTKDVMTALAGIQISAKM